jgi:DNA-directed RNA polymerase specialized sigma24 family protein
MSAVSARRGDARQTAMPSMRAQLRHDRRGDNHEHRASCRPSAGPRSAPHVDPDRAAPTPVDGTSGRRSRRREQLGAFYARNAARLRRIVASRVNADEHTLDEACSHAWERLVDSDDIVLDRLGLAWLAKVAIREGWRLAALGRREMCATAVSDAPVQSESLLAERTAVADDHGPARIEHHERVRIFRSLKDRERRELFLQALGYGYHEIASLTDSTYTGVNRRLAEGRAQLRRRDAAPTGGDCTSAVA